MRRTAQFLAAILLVTVVACGDDGPSEPPPSPPPPPPPLSVVLSSDTLTAFGQIATVTAVLGDQSTNSPALTLESETRTLASLPVLDGSELAQGVIRAAGPGTARVVVAAFDRAATVTVTVRVSEPIVVDFQQVRRDTLLLKGLNLDGEFKIWSSVGILTVASATSNELRIALTAIPHYHCWGLGVADSLLVIGALVAAPLRFSFTHPRSADGEVQVAAEASVRLPAGSSCLRLPAIDSAGYALVYYDTRALQNAITGPEILRGTPPLTVGIEDRTAGLPVRAQVTDGRASSAVPSADSHAYDPLQHLWERTTPWVLGEEFESINAKGQTGVYRVTHLADDDRLVFAVFLPEAGTNGLAAKMDTAATFMDAQGMDYLRTIFGPPTPITSAGSGQLLVLLSDFAGSLAGVVQVNVDTPARSVIWMNADFYLRRRAEALVLVLAHEVAHTFQYDYLNRGFTVNRFDAEYWLREGGADVLMFEAMRRYFNHFPDPDANLAVGSSLPYGFSSLAQARGDLLSGYGPAASFLYDLVWRRTLTGETRDDALRNVILASLEGWYGYSVGDRPRRPGLVARMRALIPDWDPVDAVHLWTASQILDDDAPQSQWQNPQFLRVSEGWWGWEHSKFLEPGKPAGECFACQLPAGGVNGFRIEDAVGLGATLNLTAPPYIEWALFRWR